VGPPSIISSVPVTHWWRADLGITLNAGNVSDWLDQVGGSVLANAVPANQPPYNAADATLAGQATISFDGVNDTLVVGNIAMPSPIFIAIVAKIPVQMNGSLYAPPGGIVINGHMLQLYLNNIYQSGAAANYNVTFDGIPPFGPWFRNYDRRHNTPQDYIKLASQTKATGIACQTSNVSGPWGLAFAGSYLGISYREIVICAGEPTPAELTALDAYFVAQGPILV